MTKHKKIAIILHSLNGLLFVAAGFIFFVVPQAFTACSTPAMAQNPSVCFYASLLFFGIPVVIALLPIVALVKFGKTARGFLWVYSIFVAVLFFPVGTAIGGHTIYLLRSTTKGLSSTKL
jgi:hypothetical protein